MNRYRLTVWTLALLVAVCWMPIYLQETLAQESTDETVGTPTQETDAVADEQELQTLLVHDKRLQLIAPAAWKVVEPRNNLIELELTILPGDRADEPDNDASDEPKPRGRLTMMAAGGDVDGNIRRWVGQFRLGRDADGKDAMRRDRRKLRGAVAHVLDIAGTYFDSPRGPFGPKVELADYRMLGAIIEVEGAGKYFVKFYGPAEIVEENHEAFQAMLESLVVVDGPGEESGPEADDSAAAEEVGS